MATIDITTQSGAVGNGDLQLQNGAPMDATLRFVTDAINTASPLKLSTSLVQTTSTLKITTNDNPYIDAEDGSGNNRFTVGRAPASQQVNVDFASNPTGSTTAVGAIRTYRDGTNLSEAMTFIEDGSVGIGTTAPVGILDLFKSAAATRLAIRGDAGQNRLISYRTGALQRWGLYVNNTAESGANAGSDFAIRSYNDAGALLNTPFFIKRSTSNVGIGTNAPAYNLQINAASDSRILITDSAQGSTANDGTYVRQAGVNSSIVNQENGILQFGTNNSFVQTITSAGIVGIGTTTPQADSKLHVVRASSGITARTDLGGVIIAEGSTRSGLYILTAGTDANSYGSIWWGNGNVNTDASIKVNNSTRAMIFSLQDDTERMRITAGGNVGIGTTTPTQKLDVAGRITAAGNDYHALSVDQGSAQLRLERTGTSTGVNYIGADNAGLKIFNSSFGVLATFTANGLTFNGDTAAANALDDYEEGTWTPTFVNCTFTGSTTAKYTKIGNVVNVQLSFINQTISSASGGASITGLPFTANINGFCAGSINYADAFSTTDTSVRVGQGTNELFFNQNTSTTDAVFNNGTNNRSLILSATYFV